MTYLAYANTHRKELLILDGIDIPSKHCPRNTFAICEGDACVLERNPHFTEEERKEACSLCWNREMPGTLNVGKLECTPMNVSKLECTPISEEKIREVLQFTDISHGGHPANAERI